MATKDLLLLLLLFAFMVLVAPIKAANDSDDSDPLEDVIEDVEVNRNSFAPDFIFGTSSSAYQFEGAAHEDGRGNSIWDVFTKNHPDEIKDNSSGLIAEDTYHRYMEDNPMMKYMGWDAYRFSISWSRILPHGRKSKGVNDRGIAYYNSLIDSIISNGLKPFATLFHFDLPQALEDEYLGFLNTSIIQDFKEYAEFCFALFGDRVKHWITVNEPYTFTVTGYAYGQGPIHRCSNRPRVEDDELLPGRFLNASASATCKHGNSSTEPYLVTHHILLAHAAAVKVYRDFYQGKQNGTIGITLYTEWFVPHSNSTKDKNARDRALAFMYGWYMEPLVNGTYPIQMITNVGPRLPAFNATESELVKGSFDFIGLNYYTAEFVADTNCSKKRTYMTDPCIRYPKKRDGKPVGRKTALPWLHVYPEGLQNILEFGITNYSNPLIYVTENGVARENYGFRPNDTLRERYYKHHLSYLSKAININGSNVKGFFAWATMDNFEWLDGYTANFGMWYVHNKTLERSCKKSANWFKTFLLPPNYTTIQNPSFKIYKNCD